MSTQRYSVTPHPIETLLTWVKSGEIAIPEIQRPFVWDATKVRNLLDSLYRGYPVGYLIAWRNPNTRLKDGTTSSGKRILIDGQQRVTALMASILGHEVLTKDYETTKIRIAFHPQEERFEVKNPAISKDPSWIPDVVEVFAPEASLSELTDTYFEKNPQADRRVISRVLERLRKIIYNHVGIIDLAEDLDIETVTEIFIRVNSAGTELSQADFAMSKISVNEKYDGNLLRKAIDYFCHMAVSPEFIKRIEKTDKAFAASEFFPQMRWLKDVNDDIYDPAYTDMLRVAFTSEFQRGRLQDLVALISGRNFESKQYEESIAEESFGKLKKGVQAFINQANFEKLVMIIRSAGFVTKSLIGAQNNINFGYILYLRCRAEGMRPDDIERLVRRWYALSVVTRRYSKGNPETDIDYDIRQIESIGIERFCATTMDSELTEAFWNGLVPIELGSSSGNSPFFHAYQAAQVKMKDRGFLSKEITVHDLLLNMTDVHHVYPKAFLKGQGVSRNRYNQVANFVLAQSEINIAIGCKAPEVYFRELNEQCAGGSKNYGGITDAEEMKANFRMNCIPETMMDGQVPEYEDFLDQRRKLMALKIKTWFEAL